jgi:uncharacterized delta-60 repeat protein
MKTRITWPHADSATIPGENRNSAFDQRGLQAPRTLQAHGSFSSNIVPHPLKRLLLITLIAALPLTGSLRAAPGELDTSFNPGSGVDNTVYAIAVQPDGKIVVGGFFSTVKGLPRNRIARLHADGSGDSSFDPGTGANNSVGTVVLQSDGKVLIGGTFFTLNGVSRNGIARLNVDGSLDTGFDPGAGLYGANKWVSSIVLQSGGKMLIGGGNFYWTLNGISCTNLARFNADGTFDSGFNPGTGANGSVSSVAVQPDGKVLIGGNFTAINGISRTNIARLNADGSLDTLFNPGTGANGTVFSVAVQSDGKVLMGGDFTTVNAISRNRIARLNADGSVDTGFDSGTGASNRVRFVALQADGKVLIGGAFTTVSGTSRWRIARLAANGSLDTSFNPGSGASSDVECIAFQADGKVLIGGSFTSFNNVTRNRIARLQADGGLDATLDPGTGGINNGVSTVVAQADGKILVGGYFTRVNDTLRQYIARLNSDSSLDPSFSAGPNASVLSIALQSDGRVLVGGTFTSVYGVSRARIARLNANGSLDTLFNPGIGANGTVYSVALQPDGKVLIGGWFTTVNGINRSRIARLNSDGSLDTLFDPGMGANDWVFSFALQPDGKVLMGGAFTTVNDTNRNRIARLHADGSLDTSFNPGTGASGSVYSVALQPDGKVLVGGSFITMNGISRIYIARLHPDGSLDTSFDPGTGANGTVRSIAVQPDGNVLIAGSFTTVNGISRNRIARLNSDGSLDTSFNPGTGANNPVFSVALQLDGKVLIGGDFTAVNGAQHWYLARLMGNTVAAPVPLTLDRIGNHVVLSWPNPAFSLQAAPLVTGVYTNIPGATSPHTNPASGSQQYFRLKSD